MSAVNRLRLGINIDHVATIRNARGGKHPDPVRAARLAADAGAKYVVFGVDPYSYFLTYPSKYADIEGSPFVNLRHAGVAPARARWPKLRGFLDRICGRPSFKACIEEESPIFGKRSALITD